MDAVVNSAIWLRSILSSGGAPSGSQFCADKNVTYAHRVDNPESWNWCLVPDGGFDAIFFAALAIATMCLASPRWDALIVLFFGGIYFTFSYYWNLEHVSNAVMLWLGMRPADIFVYVFLPPFLLDLSVRIDFFMLKKVAFNIAFMAFVMVAASALILIPFMLYALDLQSSGWTAAHVALFGSMIASTDAASVSAVLRSGGGPEILSVLLEGESLFNDASSLTLFEIFKEVVLESAHTTLAQDLRGIVVMTIWSAFTGICIGLAMGIFTRWVFAWLQHRNMEAMAEVAWSVAGAYLSFYITQVWCKGSGCIGAVAFGLYGSATLLWGMSTKARLSGIFTQFWAVMTFVINGLIFFYVGASSVNFTIRSAQTLYVDSGGGVKLVKILLYKLPLIYLASFSLRFILIFVSFKLLQLLRLSEGLPIQEVIFVTVGGLRGSLSLVLAQSAATLASSHSMGEDREQERRVKAEIAMYTAGYVIMTLLINAPLCGPLLTLLGLDKVRQEQLAMRGEVKNLFRKFTSTAIEDLAAGQDEDELLQGLDWAMLKLHTEFDKQLDKELPETQPRVHWLSWLSWLRAPARLWRYLLACFRGRFTPDALELDQSEEALARQRQDAELKRATNANVRELQSRAPGALSMPFAASPVRLPTALIIRDTTAGEGKLGAANGGGRGAALPQASSYPPVGTGARRPPAPDRSVRRSRRSTLVVTPSGAVPGGGGGDDREPSVHGPRGGGSGSAGYTRSGSRFLEGAVAGPAITRVTSLQRRSQPGEPAPTEPAAAAVAPFEGPRGGTGDGGSEPGPEPEPPQIEVVLSPPSACIGVQELQQLQDLPLPGGGGADGGGSLLDAKLLSLTAAQESGPVGAEAPTGGGTAAPPPAASATASRRPSRLSPGASGGDSLIDAALRAADSTVGTEAAAAAAPPPPGSSGTPAPAPSTEPQSLPLPQRSSDLLAPSPASGIGLRLAGPPSPSLRGPGAAGRPSPLSRGMVGALAGSGGPPAATLSRLHVSTSLPRLVGLDGLDEEQPRPQAAPPRAGTGSLAGVVSEPEPEPSRTSPAVPPAAERGLLQSVLVIKPGAGTRGSALPSSSLNPSSSVRLVQRLGDDNGRGSALEALRTDTMSGAGGRGGLGRGSVRLATQQQQQQQQMMEFAQPPEADAGSMMAWAAAKDDQPLGRRSVSAPNTGRPQPRLEEPSMRSAGTEPPSLGPFEFALPEDMAAGPSFMDPFHGGARGGGGGGAGGGGALGRSSVRAGGGGGGLDGGLGRSSIRTGAAAVADGGGLARGSIRQGAGPAGGGGGALARGSMRLGRQGGLAAVSTQLARIYDADGASAAAAAAAAAGDFPQPTGRRSMTLDPPPPARASLTFDGRSQSTAGAPPPRTAPASPVPQALRVSGSNIATTSNHIALQVANIQQRELARQLAAESTALQQQQQHAQYGLGSTSKGVLMSLIRRSASNARSYTSGGGGGAGGGGGGSAHGGGRDLSGRGAEYNNLARRTRFADSTAAALARASASVAFRQASSEIDAGSGGMCDPLLVEYRLRLLTGLKQYYRQKHAAGSLSPSSFKVLNYVAEQSAHHPEHPLELWTMAKKEISSGPLIDAEVAVYFRLKQWTAAAKTSSVALVRKVVPRLLVPFVRLISSHTSAATLRGLETAVELWASLTQSLQTEWLQYSGMYGERLLEEVQHEADGAWAYIIERRIESPKKFGAVQTHRAVIDVLTQQQAFVREMNEGGMIEEGECRKIVEMVEKRLQLLARRGPRWRQPTVMEILQGTAVLRGVPPRVVEWIRKNSKFQVYPQGAAIWDMGRRPAGSEPDGLIIVIRGVVRMMLQQEDALVPYYLGAGGVGGLVSCVLESHVPGMSSAAAYAEGNALGKGPLVMHVPWSVLQVLRRFSREERLAPYQALDLQMYRTAAVYVLDLLRTQVTQQFSAFIRSSLLTILSSQRLDGPTVRRQRIRLLLQPAASDHIVDGAIDWISELLSCDPDIARQLLETSSPAAHPAGSPAGTFHHHSHLHNHNHSHHNHLHSHHHIHHVSSAPHLANHLTCGSAGSGSGRGGGDSAHGGDAAATILAAGGQQGPATLARIAAAPWVEMMYKAIAAATAAVLDIIRSSLKDSMLVVLGPRQGIVQRTTMVLIQGSLEPAPIADADGTGGAGGAGGPFVASNNELHVAPSVMVWVSDYFEGELVAQKELRVVAGPRGATLLLWGVKPEDLLLPSPKAEPVGGAGEPAAAAPSPGGRTPPAGGGGRSDGEQQPRRLLSVVRRARAQDGGGKVRSDAAAAAAAAASAFAAAKAAAAAAVTEDGGAAVNGGNGAAAVNGRELSSGGAKEAAEDQRPSSKSAEEVNGAGEATR